MNTSNSFRLHAALPASFAAAALLSLPAAAFGQVPVISQGIYQSAPPVLANGQTSILQADQFGNLSVREITDNFALTQTAVAVGTTATPILAANPTRKYLAWMVVGPANVTCAPGAGGVAVGSGFVFTASGSNAQGAAQEFPHGAPTSAFQCIAAAAGSTVIVWEGN